MCVGWACLMLRPHSFILPQRAGGSLLARCLDSCLRPEHRRRLLFVPVYISLKRFHVLFSNIPIAINIHYVYRTPEDEIPTSPACIFSKVLTC